MFDHYGLGSFGYMYGLRHFGGQYRCPRCKEGTIYYTDGFGRASCTNCGTFNDAISPIEIDPVKFIKKVFKATITKLRTLSALVAKAVKGGKENGQQSNSDLKGKATHNV